MDTESLLRSLNAREVHYVVIGATAFPLETDIHPFVTGVTFDEVWRNRVEDRIGQTPAPFASLDDLIRMKQAAGRPKDLEDLRVLTKLKEQREQNPQPRGDRNG